MIVELVDKGRQSNEFAPTITILLFLQDLDNLLSIKIKLKAIKISKFK